MMGALNQRGDTSPIVSATTRGFALLTERIWSTRAEPNSQYIQWHRLIDGFIWYLHIVSEIALITIYEKQSVNIFLHYEFICMYNVFGIVRVTWIGTLMVYIFIRTDAWFTVLYLFYCYTLNNLNPPGFTLSLI